MSDAAISETEIRDGRLQDHQAALEGHVHLGHGLLHRCKLTTDGLYFLCSTAELWRRMVRAIHPNGTENEGGGQRFRYFAVDGLSGAALCEMQTLQRSH